MVSGPFQVKFREVEGIPEDFRVFQRYEEVSRALRVVLGSYQRISGGSRRFQGHPRGLKDIIGFQGISGCSRGSQEHFKGFQSIPLYFRDASGELKDVSGISIGYQ